MDEGSTPSASTNLRGRTGFDMGLRAARDDGRERPDSQSAGSYPTGYMLGFLVLAASEMNKTISAKNKVAVMPLRNNAPAELALAA